MFTRLLLALFAFTFFASAEDSYVVRLVRPMKVGDRFDVSAKVAFEDGISTTFDGAPVENDKTTVACRLTATLSVDAVTTKGMPKELRLKLKTVDCVEDGQPAKFFKPGDEIHLRKAEPDNIIQVNGEAAADIQAQVVESLLSVEDEGEVTDDDVFGTTDKVTVGTDWPINAKAAVTDIARYGIKGLEPAGVSGRTKLVKTSTFENAPALVLRVEMKMDGKDIAMTSLPENVKATRFHTEFAEELNLPVDLAATGGHSKGMVIMEIDGAGKAERGGLQVNIAMKIRRRVATDTTAVPVK